jgi:hypothetical protein
MLVKIMQIIKHKESKVNVDYFFFKGKVDLDEKYFIEQIKKGTAAPEENNYRTNIKGKMTDWKFFVQDENFLEVFRKFVRYLDENITLSRYFLTEAWGLELNFNERTLFHSHMQSLWSGVLYLSSSNQTLDFPQIGEKLKPEIGSFALFSPFLEHGCARSNDQFPKYGISFNASEIKPWE